MDKEIMVICQRKLNNKVYIESVKMVKKMKEMKIGCKNEGKLIKIVKSYECVEKLKILLDCNWN